MTSAPSAACTAACPAAFPPGAAPSRVSRAWFQAIVDAARRSGVRISAQVDRLLSQGGFNPQDVDADPAWVDAERVDAFWRRLEAHSDLPTIAALVGRHIELTAIPGLGFTLLTAPTLADFVDAWVAGHALIERGPGVRLQRGRSSTGLWIAHDRLWPGDHHHRDALIAAIAATLERRLAPATRTGMTPVALTGSDGVLRIDLPPETRLSGGHAELHAVNRAVMLRLVDQARHGDLSGRVRAALPALLASGSASQQTIAAQFHISVSSLIRRLRAEGVSYRELVDEVRQSMARDFLVSSNLPVTEIAFTLGFNDASNFTRAFRRWFKAAPSRYRGYRDGAGALQA